MLPKNAILGGGFRLYYWVNITADNALVALIMPCICRYNIKTAAYSGSCSISVYKPEFSKNIVMMPASALYRPCAGPYYKCHIYQLNNFLNQQ